MSRTTKSESWDKMRGKVSRIYSDKGFGFIKGDDEQDYFVHYTAVSRPDWDEFIKCNNRGEEILVEFTPTKGVKGPRAEDVTRYA